MMLWVAPEESKIRVDRWQKTRAQAAASRSFQATVSTAHLDRGMIRLILSDDCDRGQLQG